MTMQNLAPGFRFYPIEEELVDFYLRNKLRAQKEAEIGRVIKLIDIYSIEPWDLPKFAGELCQGDTEQWFFFTARQEREARGGRPNRTTPSGYWKATGSPNYVYSSDKRIIGVKKTMIFYKGKAPTGSKTKWKMNEYRVIEEIADPNNVVTRKLRHEFSLCRVYVISGSCRAFDRRPLEITNNDYDETMTSRDNTDTMVAISSGSEFAISTGSEFAISSGSEFGNLADHPGNMEINEQTLFDLEQQWPSF